MFGIFKRCNKDSILKYKYDKFDEIMVLINKYKDESEHLYSEDTKLNFYKKHRIYLTLIHFVNLFISYLIKEDDKDQIDGAFRLIKIQIKTYIDDAWLNVEEDEKIDLK